jgi:hypothetical protein
VPDGKAGIDAFAVIRDAMKNQDRVAMAKAGLGFYLFDFRFSLLFFFFAVFFGTFCPAALASERPIAIACLRLFTLRPERPLLKVPRLRSLIARRTLADAFFEYLRAITFLPVTRN